ncbi:MAG: hypothetical protein GF421_06240 [Candidatus Aminicenantes bacterium]|nr:hypothetical protein [Candidatus Aminicenantes bacterium]
MSRVYCQRHPERTVFHRMLFHYFEPFLLEYENRFERHFGHLRHIIQEVVDKYLDCGKEALIKYLKAATKKDLTPGIIAVIQSFGRRINFHPHLHFLVTEGGIAVNQSKPCPKDSSRAPYRIQCSFQSQD